MTGVKGLTVWLSVLAGMQTLTAGSSLAGYIGAKPAGILSLIVAALLTATSAYTAQVRSISKDDLVKLAAIASNTEVTTTGHVTMTDTHTEQPTSKTPPRGY